ncbi:MAG: hypothetical protein HQM16_18880 [Deltaproteobacteria bacterium]|nr:hypothetical protein [Deltaproteobacteria bacterium]
MPQGTATAGRSESFQLVRTLKFLKERVDWRSAFSVYRPHCAHTRNVLLVGRPVLGTREQTSSHHILQKGVETLLGGSVSTVGTDIGRGYLTVKQEDPFTVVTITSLSGSRVYVDTDQTRLSDAALAAQSAIMSLRHDHRFLVRFDDPNKEDSFTSRMR